MGINKQQRNYWYPKVVYKFNKEACNGCGVVIYPSYALVLPEIPILISKLNLNYWINSTKGKKLCTILYLDHIDNDDSHNDLDNFQLLCPACNHIKNPRRAGNNISKRTKTPEMERGDKQENDFREWVRKEVLRDDWIKVDDVVYGGAEYLTNFSEGKTISPETTKRYLAKMTSITGQYTIKKDYLTFKYKLPQLDEWLQRGINNRDQAIQKTRELTETYE